MNKAPASWSELWYWIPVLPATPFCVYRINGTNTAFNANTVTVTTLCTWSRSKQCNHKSLSMSWKRHNSLNFDLLNTGNYYSISFSSPSYFTARSIFVQHHGSNTSHVSPGYDLRVRQALPYDLESDSRNTASSSLMNHHVLFYQRVNELWSLSRAL